MGESVLCYVDGCWAYFTTQALRDQWGDDWNDAPYEHNAGIPYGYDEHDKKQGKAPWDILKVAYDGPFVTPDDRHLNSPYSVESINAGACAWLRSESWGEAKPVIIPAGTTLEAFVALIREGGGQVYIPTKEEDSNDG